MLCFYLDIVDVSVVISACAGVAVAYFTRTLTRVAVAQQRITATQDAREADHLRAMQAIADALQDQSIILENQNLALRGKLYQSVQRRKD